MLGGDNRFRVRILVLIDSRKWQLFLNSSKSSPFNDNSGSEAAGCGFDAW